MSKTCPNCKMYQITVFGFYRRICEHCGYNLEKKGKELTLPTQEQILNIKLNDAFAQIKDQNTRIAELEAEVASLKDQTKAKWVEAYSRICANTTEEGEG